MSAYGTRDAASTLSENSLSTRQNDMTTKRLSHASLNGHAVTSFSSFSPFNLNRSKIGGSWEEVSRLPRFRPPSPRKDALDNDTISRSSRIASTSLPFQTLPPHSPPQIRTPLAIERGRLFSSPLQRDYLKEEEEIIESPRLSTPTTLRPSSSSRVKTPSTRRNENKAMAETLVSFLLSNPTRRRAILLSHFWFAPTPSLLEALCQRAIQDPDQRQFLSDNIVELLSFSSIDDLSRQEISEIVRLIPLTLEFEKMRRSCNSAAWPFFTQRASRLTSPVRPKTSSPSFSLFRPQQSRSFADLITGIEEGRRDYAATNTIRDLAWDLKKLTSALLIQIRPSEFAAYKAHLPSPDAPHIKEWIDHTNTLIYFIISHILSYPDPLPRSRCCTFYIRLMVESKEIGNLSSAFLLLGALNNSSIKRLKITWDGVPGADRGHLEEMETLFDQGSNFHHYREHLKKLEGKSNKPSSRRVVIPLFDRYLHGFTFTAEGNPTYLENGALNPHKIDLLGEQHALFQKYQEGARMFKSELLEQEDKFDLRDHLQRTHKALAEIGINPALESLYETSQQREPSTSPITPHHPKTGVE